MLTLPMCKLKEISSMKLRPSGENVRKQLAKLRKHVLRDVGEIQGTRKRETFEEVKRVWWFVKRVGNWAKSCRFINRKRKNLMNL